MWMFLKEPQPLFVYEPLFTPQECDDIIQFGLAHCESSAPEILTEDGWKSSEEYRSCLTRSISPNIKESLWMFQRLQSFIEKVNYDCFRYDLQGIIEPLQLLEYNSPSGKYKKHIDKIQYDIVRKFTVIVNLSDHKTYDGGELQLHAAEDPLVPPKTIGTAVIFPSHLMHSVTTLTRGTRFSLVAWVSGPPLR